MSQAVRVHMPVVTALGWAIVHFLWEGTLIALALAAALAVCRGARVRYGAASLAMLAMLTAFGVTLAVSIPGPEAAVPSARTAAAADAGGTAAISAREPTALECLQGVLPWVVPFWMAGALLVGLYRLAGWMAAQRVRWEGVCAAPAEWQARLARLARRIGVSKPLVLLESSLADAPLVIGLFRPVILVPVGMLAGLPPSYLEAILLHELAHIRRFDYLVNLMQTLVKSLLFYHPAVWWVSAEMRAERENCCDDLVVAVEGDARVYAAALVTLEERRSAGREPALAASGGKLMLRIRRLLNQPEQRRAGAALVLSLGLLLGLFCLFAAARQADSDKADPQGKAAQTRRQAEPVYDKWLNEDVVYIITADERAAFGRLRSDRERERFIEQFWLRRDPTPGTTENEFKDEHYRRIGLPTSAFSGPAPPDGRPTAAASTSCMAPRTKSTTMLRAAGLTRIPTSNGATGTSKESATTSSSNSPIRNAPATFA
jgi:GWxTD domain-containing protein